MTTKLIGVKEFRANMARYAARAQRGGVRFVVMHRTQPLFEIKPFSADADFSDVLAAVTQGREDKKKGHVYSQDDMLAEFA